VVRVVKKKQNIEADTVAAEKVKKNSKDIVELGFSSRTEKALLGAGLKKLEDVKGKTKTELLEIKGVGAKAVEEILKIVK